MKNKLLCPAYVDTKVQFTQLQMHLAIEAMKNYPWDKRFIKDVEIRWDEDFCSCCKYPEHVDIYISFETEQLKKMFPGGKNNLNIYWKRKKDENSGEFLWSLVKYAPCNNHFSDIFKGREAYESCFCPEIYMEKVCKKIKRITDKVLSLDTENLVVNNLLNDIE